MNQSQIRSLLILAVMAIAVNKVTGQSTLPDELTKNPLKEQLKYLEDRTRIYENYRAIREDMFQKLKDNVNDTLSEINRKTNNLTRSIFLLNQTIDTLRNNLASTKTRFEEMTRTKNSIRLIGMEVNKITYNNIMWTILAGLVAALLSGFLVFKRNLSTLFRTRKDLQELKDEFETYRKTSREAREKMTMDHFNEIKRLKGG